MTGREWKPGDVAMVRWKVNGEWRGDVCVRTSRAAVGDVWQSALGWLGDCSAKEVRTLAVIDPEDREVVMHLAESFQSNEASVSFRGNHVDAMQAALRSLADPKPPRPEEPTGLGAVIEDADGRCWVRGSTRLDDESAWTSSADIDCADWATWSEIDVVRVLSEGVQP